MPIAWRILESSSRKNDINSVYNTIRIAVFAAVVLFVPFILNVVAWLYEYNNQE